jgi:hypothetical protein
LTQGVAMLRGGDEGFSDMNAKDGPVAE